VISWQYIFSGALGIPGDSLTFVDDEFQNKVIEEF
jgi:hypothetical protein